MIGEQVQKVPIIILGDSFLDRTVLIDTTPHLDIDVTMVHVIMADAIMDVDITDVLDIGTIGVTGDNRV